MANARNHTTCGAAPTTAGRLLECVDVRAAIVGCMLQRRVLDLILAECLGVVHFHCWSSGGVALVAPNWVHTSRGVCRVVARLGRLVPGYVFVGDLARRSLARVDRITISPISGFWRPVLATAAMPATAIGVFIVRVVCSSLSRRAQFTSIVRRARVDVRLSPSHRWYTWSDCVLGVSARWVCTRILG